MVCNQSPDACIEPHYRRHNFFQRHRFQCCYDRPWPQVREPVHLTYISRSAALCRFMVSRLATEAVRQAKHCVKYYGGQGSDPSKLGTSCNADIDCGTNATCSPLQRCYTALDYGAGLLPATACESSSECRVLDQTAFRCDSTTAKCTFRAPGQSAYAVIERWQALQCESHFDCSSAAVRGTLLCSAPWFDTQVSPVSYARLNGASTRLQLNGGQISTVLVPNCVLGPSADLQLTSNIEPALDTRILVSSERQLGTGLMKSTFCTGSDCYCAAPDVAAGGGRLFGSTCEEHKQCTGIDSSLMRCGTVDPRSCQYYSSELQDWRDIGIRPNSQSASLACSADSDCTSAISTSAVCQGVPRCKLGPSYGGHYLPDVSCLSDLDCSKLLESQFRCHNDGVSGTCQFSMLWDSVTSEGTWKAIPGLKVDSVDNKQFCLKYGKSWCMQFRDAGELKCDVTSPVSVYNLSETVQLQSYGNIANVTTAGVVQTKAKRRIVDNQCLSNASKAYVFSSDTCVAKVGKYVGRTGTCTAGEYGGTIALETCAIDADCAAIPDARFRCATTNPTDESGLSPVPLGYCESLVQTDLSSAYDHAVPIPSWALKKLFCTTNANCSSAAVKSARRCEHRACRVGAQFGGGRLLGSTCSTSADCQNLDIDRFKCVCDSVKTLVCPDPSGGLGTAASSCIVKCQGPENMRCAYAPTGQTVTAFPIPGAAS